MSNDIAIRVENLGKRYVIGRQTEYRDSVIGRAAQLAVSPFSWLTSQIKGPAEEEILWALRNVSFEVKRGEVLGIIGRNGAGKSTLLKILSRITEPTRGHAEMHGRVGSLLEVGTGMHPELTGRENIYLNGCILGMRKAEIDAKFDDIVDFSGIEKFLDTPVKRYSSGMRVRLGFSIAAHLEPEILIVDEVLAVGDAEFQKRCLGKMKDVAGHGRTVLFVSHNMTAVQNLCGKAMLLCEGIATAMGSVNDIVEEYLDTMGRLTGEALFAAKTQAVSAGGEVSLQAVRIVSDGTVTAEPSVESEIEVQIDYWNLQEGGRRLVSIWLVDGMGQPVFTTANIKSASLSPDEWVEKAYPVGLFRTTCTIPGYLLNPGKHRIHLYINQRGASDNLLRLEDVIAFNVVESPRFRQDYLGKWIGAVRPLLEWRTEPLELAHPANITSETV